MLAGTFPTLEPVYKQRSSTEVLSAPPPPGFWWPHGLLSLQLGGLLDATCPLLWLKPRRLVLWKSGVGCPSGFEALDVHGRPYLTSFPTLRSVATGISGKAQVLLQPPHTPQIKQPRSLLAARVGLAYLVFFSWRCKCKSKVLDNKFWGFSCFSLFYFLH